MVEPDFLRFSTLSLHAGHQPDSEFGARAVPIYWSTSFMFDDTDHAASLEPDGLRRLVRDIRHVKLALNRKSSEILPIEIPQRERLKRCSQPYRPPENSL